MNYLLAALAWLFLGTGSASAQADSSSEFLDSWLQKQAQVQTWSADVVQIRKLKALTRPLKSTGQVWFSRPNRFRWQLGDPPRTIAVRTKEELVVTYPRLKQAERYAARDAVDESWKKVLALLEVGFPSTAEAFRSEYELVSATESDGLWRVELRPASRAARKFLEVVRMEISGEDFLVQATELAFPDGSIMRNKFSNHELDPELDEALFIPEIKDDYRVVNPLRR